MVKQFFKILFLFSVGGLLYNLLELCYRCWTHWTMFFLGGLCFVCLGAINEIIQWAMPLWLQIAIGACIITGLESGQYPGPGVPTVLWTVAGGGLGWDHSGRLPAILVVW